MNTAAIGAVAAIGVALLGGVGVLVGHAFTRIGRVEERMDRVSEENRHLWLWARSLVDYGYRNRRSDVTEDLPTFEDTVTRERGKPPAL